MKIIVTLGNPGDKYTTTRHNAGFIFADVLVSEWGYKFKFESKFNAKIAKCEFNNEQIWIVKPQTYMNLSGFTVRELLNFYKLTNKDIFIVYDDLSMNIGALRFRASGSDGGHNGIKSIITSVGTTSFDRLKIGIGPQPSFMAAEAYVLQNFTKDQLIDLSEVIKKAIEASEFYIKNGLNSAQNNFNSK